MNNIKTQEAMENFVFPDNFQGMLIFVKWHQKKENVILSQFCMGTKLLSDVGVCAALFRRKIWTKGGWYFLLVALYYCKI